MNYETFKQLILSELGMKIPTASLSIQSVLKNNGISLDGLVIMERNTNISPTLYLNYYYENYKDGTDISAILDSILAAYHSNRPTESIDVSFFTNYHNIKNKIAYKLINYEKNEKLLKDIPHYRYLDLAIVFYCLISTSVSGSATILIRNQHLTFWNISKTQLFEKAKENTPHLLSYDLRNLSDIMKELSAEDCNAAFPETKEDAAFCPMYVLTNQNKLNGASCILYEHLLESFSDKLNSDLYILPSSIHEVILIPAQENISCQELAQMVREVNDTQVDAEEILSNHVYYFSRSLKTVTM